MLKYWTNTRKIQLKGRREQTEGTPIKLVSSDDKVRLVSNHGACYAPNLECAHEEADTRIMWHTS